MVRRLAVPLLLVLALPAVPLRSGGDLRVHEWGTFTSMAGPDGESIPWSPLGGPSDLPCFVRLLNPTNLKVGPAGLGGVKALVRMETPVLYFYSSREQRVQVDVRFPQGIITEWYPQARVPQPTFAPSVSFPHGSIAWDDVTVLPGTNPRLPVDGDTSHYYAARETDAAPVRVGRQDEKFLFYRGLANFRVPVKARILDARSVAVEYRGDPEVNTFVLFERDADRAGYRIVRDAAAQVTIERPALTSSIDAVRRDLRALLVERGLFQAEANAMVETWRDTWFEQGVRVFYLLPPPLVDTLLPLTIEPAPLDVTRVFVGRVELKPLPAPSSSASPAGPRICEAPAR